MKKFFIIPFLSVLGAVGAIWTISKIDNLTYELSKKREC